MGRRKEGTWDYATFNCYRLKELKPEEVNRYMELTTSFHMQGRKEGKRDGKIEGICDAIVKVFSRKFGSEPNDLRENHGRRQPK